MTAKTEEPISESDFAQISANLEQIGIELLMLGDNAGDLVTLVSLVELVAQLKAFLTQQRLERGYQMAHAIDELLTSLLCEQCKQPAATLTLTNELLAALKGHIDSQAEGQDNSEQCLPLITKSYEFLQIKLVSLAGTSTPANGTPPPASIPSSPDSPSANPATPPPNPLPLPIWPTKNTPQKVYPSISKTPIYIRNSFLNHSNTWRQLRIKSSVWKIPR